MLQIQMNSCSSGTVPSLNESLPQVCTHRNKGSTPGLLGNCGFKHPWGGSECVAVDGGGVQWL